MQLSSCLIAAALCAPLAAAARPDLLSPSPGSTSGAPPSEERGIELVANGAIARFGPHQVTFAADAHLRGAVEIRLRDVVLRTHVIGLCYYNEAGEGVLLAGVKSRIGELVGANQVVYRDAFDREGVSGDIVYTYTASSLEQDIVIQKQLPPPAACGVESTRVRLGVVTEFEASVEPKRTAGTIAVRAQNVAPGIVSEETLPDETLDFGPLQIVAGKALIAGDPQAEIPIAKNWLGYEGCGERRFLIETTPYELIQPMLDQLPKADTAGQTAAKVPSLKLALQQAGRGTSAAAGPQRMTVARADSPSRSGVVLDYLMVVAPEAQVASGKTDTDRNASRDAWEMHHFGSQSRNGRGDPDGDGVSDDLGRTQGRNARVAGRVGDTNAVIRLTVFSPLK
jgi:hypothetical protein